MAGGAALSRVLHVPASGDPSRAQVGLVGDEPAAAAFEGHREAEPLGEAADAQQIGAGAAGVERKRRFG